MNINELFENIQNVFSDEIHGEYLLLGNVIIWSYKITEENDEENFLNDDDDEFYDFESMSSEEILQEEYQEEFDKLQEFLDGIEEIDNWKFSDSEIVDNVISFKIF